MHYGVALLLKIVGHTLRDEGESIFHRIRAARLALVVATLSRNASVQVEVFLMRSDGSEAASFPSQSFFPQL